MTHRLRVLACSAALLMLGAAAPARAQIDLSGEFHLEFTSLAEICEVTVTQTGAAIDFLLQCVFTQAGAIGTIDPLTGVFTANGGCTVGPLFGTLAMSGTAAADSSSFSGALSCPPAIPGGPYAFTATRRCSDSPAAGCRVAGKSLLVLKDSGNDPSDKLTWKWLKGAATTQQDFGVPTGTSGYTLCIYAGSVAAPIAQANVPPDATIWQPISDKGWKYKDQSGAASGVTKVLLKGGADGKSKVLMKGKGDGLPDLLSGVLPVESAEFPVSVQLLRNGTNLCWESAFAEADVKKNTEEFFKAKSATP